MTSRWRAEPAGPASSGAGEPVTLRAVSYEVAHQISGRIRLRIPRLAHDRAFARRLIESVGTVPTLEQARIGARSCSLVVTYRCAQPGPPDARSNGRPPQPAGAILPLVVERMRIAAGADVARDLARPASPASPATCAGADTGRRDEARPDYARRLGLPALGLGLSAAAVAGAAVPGLLVGGVILTAAVPIFKRTAQGIREERRLPVDFLDALAIVLMTAQGSFLVPAFVVGVIEGAEIVRASTARRPARTALDVLLPGERQALVERAGGAQWLPWGGLGRGDVVLIRAGERLPVDGTVLEGRGLVDEHQLTGVAAPIRRREGHRVRATTLLLQGQLRVRTTRTGEGTVAAGLVATAQRAPGSDTRISNHARKVGNPAVVPTLAVGAGVWATSGSVARAAGIAGLDLGTGMRVSAPIAARSAQAYAARHGILIRSGRALEQLARVTAVVFDKTGTLTEGQVRVVDVRAVANGVSPEDVLRLAAAADGMLDHPVARAVAACARERGIVPLRCNNRQAVVGQGVVAQIAGQRVYVGSRRLLARAGIDAGAEWER